MENNCKQQIMYPCSVVPNLPFLGTTAMETKEKLKVCYFKYYFFGLTLT